MPELSGVRVALLEARKSGEMANLVRRYGGEPVCVPAVRESPVPSPDAVVNFIDTLLGGSYAIVVFLTGAAARHLFEEADRQERFSDLVAGLNEATTLCRGPKPSAVLRQYGVRVGLGTEEPHTTTEVLSILETVGVNGKRLAVLHYGERDEALVSALVAQSARLDELCLYEWLMPEDLSTLKNLVREIVAGAVQAVAFTSQIQARHLFQVAGDISLSAELAEALNRRAVTAAIGPVCADALRRLGVHPRVIPGRPKMAPFVAELARRFRTST